MAYTQRYYHRRDKERIAAAIIAIIICLALFTFSSARENREESEDRWVGNLKEGVYEKG